jgi:hypothetical protein
VRFLTFCLQHAVVVVFSWCLFLLPVYCTSLCAATQPVYYCVAAYRLLSPITEALCLTPKAGLRGTNPLQIYTCS